MAAGLIGTGTGRRQRYRPLAEINVTPMVDVMLVLLIIFMVAAPLMTVGVPVDLPKTQASALNQENEPITITVNPEGQIFLQETEVPLEGLVEKLRAIASAQAQGGAAAGPAAGAAGGTTPERRIFVRGDRAISYGRVMEVMGTISAGGFSRVALLAEQPAGRAPAAAPTAPPGPRSQAPAPRPATPARPQQGATTTR
jgi:biopolymer transport protein TolR